MTEPKMKLVSFVLAVLSIALALTGCASAPASTEGVLVDTPAASSQSFIVQIDPTAAPTAEPTPVPTPTPTHTPTPAPTSVPEFIACELPQGFRLRNGCVETEIFGVYRFTYGDVDVLVSYGGISGAAAAFYPCDADGFVAYDATAEARSYILPDYTPTKAAKEDGLLQLIVYIGTQSVVAFRSSEGDWLVERIMICSTGRGNGWTPSGTYSIYQVYRLKRLGTSPSHYCYGQYACRFYRAYLFHSVPIDYAAGGESEIANAQCMMFMEEYEKLGSPASSGCVRLAVIDAKWIYDNCTLRSTRVKILEGDGPIATDPPKVIWAAPFTDENGLGWDPTDPDPQNPYNGLRFHDNAPTPSPC